MSGPLEGKPQRVDAVRGTQDFLPEESERWRRAEARIRHVLRVHGFGEIGTPVFESVELFRRPLGLGSDVVAKEMYEFTDRGGRSLALRPEGTAPVVRAFISHGIYAKRARTKFFYTGPIFRYDRPQAGRFRQHHQFGVEVFGDICASQDAEVMDAGAHVLEVVGVRGYEVRVNTGGCPRCRPAYEMRLKEYAQSKKGNLCKDCAGFRLEHNVMRILDCKNERCRDHTGDAPDITESLCGDCAAHFKSLAGHLGVLGLDYVRDPRLFRGFDYYTRTVFEFVAPEAGAQGTLLGGGRYDGLVELLGGPATPAVGWGMGLERVLAASSAPSSSVAPLAYVVAATDGSFQRAMRVCRTVRRDGISCELGQEGKSLNSQMRAAGAAGSRFAIIVGEDESEVGLKDLKAGGQDQVPTADLAGRLRSVGDAPGEEMSG